MANVYPLEPEDPEDFDPAGLPWAASARATAISAIDEDPDEMARAIQLTQGTGVSPGLVYRNLAQHERNARAALTGELIDTNPAFQAYINANPTHAVTSNDDWGQLSKVSEKLLEQSGGTFANLRKTVTDLARPAETFGRGFMEGIGGPKGLIPGSYAALEQAAGGPEELLKYRYNAPALYWALTGVGLIGDVFRLGFSGPTYGVARVLEEAAGELIGKEAAGELHAGLMTGVEYAGTAGMAGQLHQFPRAGMAAEHNAALHASILAAAKELRMLEPIIRPFAEANRPVPPGLHPAIDKVKLEQAKVDAKIGDEVLKESEASATRERSPEAFRAMVGEHPPLEIRIPADAIRRLYGEKEPVPEDGKLGWVPNINQQLREAEATGGNVKVSRADFLANVDREVYDALHDDIIWRKEGVSLAEGEALKEDWDRKKEEEKVQAKETETPPKEVTALPELVPPEIKQETLPELPAEAPLKITVRPVPKPEEVAARKVEVSASVEGFGRDAILRSDAVRDEARVVAAERGIPLEEAFAEVANDLFKQNGVKEELTPVAAKLYLDRDTAVESLRAVAGTQPEELAALAGVKELRLKPEDYPGAAKDKAGGAHSFAITDQNGREIASILITEMREGKDVYIEWIGASPQALHRSGGPGLVLGPKLMISAFNAMAEEFPNAERIGGHRVSGAREKTGTEGIVWLDIARFRKELAEAGGASPLLKGFRELMGPKGAGQWYDIGQNVREFTPKAWRPDERAAMFAALRWLNNILPDSVRVRPVRGLTLGRLEGREVPIGGIYTEFDNRGPLILFALGSKYLADAKTGRPLYEIMNTVRHEAIHALRQGGFIKDEEWAILRQAAIDNNWIKKHKVDVNYADKSFEIQLEEAVAFEFGEWGSRMRRPGFPEGVRQIFSRMKELFVEVQRIWKRVTGSDPIAEDLFKGIERGDFKYRPRGEEKPGLGEVVTERTPVEFAQRGRPSGKAKPPGKGMAEPMFEPKALELTGKYYDLYQKHMDRMDQEDLRYQIKHLEAYEKRRQTAEWKAYEESIRPDVIMDMMERPDVAAANFFRRGVIHGTELGKRPKLDPDFLTEEQKKALPEALVGKGGYDPDIIASEVGFQNGDAMIDRIVKFETARGEKSTAEYTAQLIRDEVERRTQREFGGNLEENIIREVEEHIVSNGELDRIHEDTLRSAASSETEKTFTKKEVKEWAEREFGERLISRVDTMDDLRTAGKARRLNERALLDREYKGAFKYTQQRELAMNLAAESKKFDKEMSSYDRIKRQFRKREIDSVDQPYTNFIRQILGRIGELSDAAIRDVETEVAAGDWKTLQEFVEAKQNFGFPLQVADFLYDPAYRKPVAEMTVNEFRGVLESLKSLAAVGRNEKKLMKGVEEVNFKDSIDQLVAGIKELPPGKEERIDIPPGAFKRIMNYYWASSLTLESIFNRFDKSNPLGPFNQLLVNMFSRAANYEASLERKFSKALESLPPIRNMNKKVENPFFIDPRTGELMPMSRRNLLAIVQNVGNKGNFETMLGGYGIPKDMAPEVMRWLFENTTKEDWDRAQALGDIFARGKGMSDQMYRDLGGAAPVSVETWKVSTPWGEYRGWYHPIIYDRTMPQKSVKLRGEAIPLLEEGSWERTTPSAGYTKTRTKYVGPIALDFNMVTGKLWEIVHDVAFRPTTIQLRKVFKNNDFRDALTTHYGQHYTDMLDPFLKDIIGGNDNLSQAAHVGRQTFEFIRQNAISHYVGLNPMTLAKHTLTALMNSITEVDPKSFFKAAATLAAESHESGVSNWRFAVNNSLELQRRHRNYMETIRGSHERVYGNIAAGGDLQSWLSNFTDRPMKEGIKLAGDMFKGKYLSLRDMIMWVEAQPLAFFDFGSAVPTWLARYEKALKETSGDHVEAVSQADRAVRRAHGSTAITNRPEIARSNNPILQMGTSFYGFFSHILQRRYEEAWAVRGALRGDKYYMNSKEFKVGLAAIPVIAAMTWSYFIFPGLWEETVAPIHDTKHDSWLWYLTKVGALTAGASFIGVRDVTHSMIEGRDVSSVGLAGSIVRDIFKPLVTTSHTVRRTPAYQRAQKEIKEFNAAFSAATGLSNASVARMGIFGANVYAGYDRPQSLREFWRGITTGSSKEKK